MSSPAAGPARIVGGRYRLLDKIGSGGMGTVWRAHDDLLGRTVAVKEVHLPAQLPAIEQDELRLRTMREARAAARLSHPNAITVHDVIEEDGRPWIVMQLVVANSLSAVIERDGAVPPKRVAEIGMALLGALQAAHAAGILHRDVKPANVLLGDDGRIVLTDFGVATLEGDPALTSTGLLLGSPSYVAPERARGQGVGTASDLWSLGATLYTAAEGHPPFERATVMATLTALSSEDPPAPSVGGPLAEVIIGLLQRDPADRLDAAATRRMLEDATGTTDRSASTIVVPTLAPVTRPASVETTRAERPPALPPAPSEPDPPSRRRRWVLVTLILLAVAAAGVGTAGYLSRSLAPDPSPSAGTSPAGTNLPAAFVGRWSGNVTESGGEKVVTVGLQLYAGAVGSLVGTSTYPGLRCTGELRLVSVNGNQIAVKETIVVQPTTARKCTPTVDITLIQNDKKLVFSGSDDFSGVLTEGAPTG